MLVGAGRLPDSAFVQLDSAVATGFDDYYHIIDDPDLVPLRRNKRWRYLLEKILKTKSDHTNGPDGHLQRLLELVFYSDQRYRLLIDSYQKKYGFGSKEVRTLYDSMKIQDEANVKTITKILDTYGWVGADRIGSQANAALFLVIQHADLAVQEKYLPMMRKAVGKGQAEPSSLALLEDRIALRNGKKQIYGSQIGHDPETGKYYVSPIEDEVNVNKRRAKVGLEPLEDYVKQWGIVYKPISPGSYEAPSFFERNISETLVSLALLLFIAVILSLHWIFHFKMLNSAWFWFYNILFLFFVIGWYIESRSPMNIHFQSNPIKSIFFNLTCFAMTLMLTLVINISLHRLFRKKNHFVIEILSAGAGFATLVLLIGPLYRLFYPNDASIQFFFNIVPVLVAAALFGVIRFVIYRVQRSKVN